MTNDREGPRTVSCVQASLQNAGNTQYILDSDWIGASHRNFKARVLNREWTCLNMT